jgi:holo-[acyl-carrier protein] synthase
MRTAFGYGGAVAVLSFPECLVPIGLGVDIIEVGRVRGVLERHGEAFLTRVFLPEELPAEPSGLVREAHGAKRGPGRKKKTVLGGPGHMEHLAGLFAAKEAVMKALGTGWSRGIGWTDIRILSDRHGKPHVRLTGEAGKYARRTGIAEMAVSISHTGTLAVAVAIADKVGRAPRVKSFRRPCRTR